MNEKYIITQTVDEQFKVLDVLEKLGYLWQSDKKPTELVPLDGNSDEKVIYLDLDNKTLSYSDLEYLEEVYLEIETENDEITYEDLLKQHTKVIL